MLFSAIDCYLVLILFPVFTSLYSTSLLFLDGIRLPDNHRQVVHSNGTLVMKEVVRESDEGHYTCTASNKRGASSRSGINIIIRGEIESHRELYTFYTYNYLT